MKTYCKILWPGMLVLMMSGTAFAHGAPSHDAYGYGGGWSGNGTIWFDSSGHSGYAGSLSYGTGYGYSPGYIPWLGHGHGHGPQCRHGSRHGYAKGYHHGYHKGRKHGKKHHRRRH